MLRIILLIAGVFILLRLVSRLFPSRSSQTGTASGGQTSKMVRCDFCKLYVLQDEAIKVSDDQYFCSRQHRDMRMINKDG